MGIVDYTFIYFIIGALYTYYSMYELERYYRINGIEVESFGDALNYLFVEDLNITDRRSPDIIVVLSCFCVWGTLWPVWLGERIIKRVML